MLQCTTRILQIDRTRALQCTERILQRRQTGALQCTGRVCYKQTKRARILQEKQGRF